MCSVSILSTSAMSAVIDQFHSFLTEGTFHGIVLSNGRILNELKQSYLSSWFGLNLNGMDGNVLYCSLVILITKVI